jgi:hypothetical protein
VQTVTPGDARSLHFRIPPGYCSRPPPLATESSGALKLGKPIVFPCASNREWLAWDLKLSCYDIALLATANYHGKEDCVQMLMEQFIHDCGYTSLLPESLKDVLICYQDIIVVHRKKVISSWVNYRTGQSGPSVEYVLEKVMCISQRLSPLRRTRRLSSTTSYRSCQWDTSFRLCPSIRSIFPSTSKVSVRQDLARYTMQRSHQP